MFILKTSSFVYYFHCLVDLKLSIIIVLFSCNFLCRIRVDAFLDICMWCIQSYALSISEEAQTFKFVYYLNELSSLTNSNLD